MPLSIPLGSQIRLPFPTRHGYIHIKAVGIVIPVTVEHMPNGLRVTYRSTSNSTLKTCFRRLSMCIGAREDMNEVIQKILDKKVVTL